MTISDSSIQVFMDCIAGGYTNYYLPEFPESIWRGNVTLLTWTWFYKPYIQLEKPSLAWSSLPVTWNSATIFKIITLQATRCGQNFPKPKGGWIRLKSVTTSRCLMRPLRKRKRQHDLLTHQRIITLPPNSKNWKTQFKSLLFSFFSILMYVHTIPSNIHDLVG